MVRDAALRESLSAHGKVPALALAVHVEEAFFHCSKCMIRSHLWQHEQWAALDGLPTLAETMKDAAAMAVPVAVIEGVIEQDEAQRLYQVGFEPTSRGVGTLSERTSADLSGCTGFGSGHFTAQRDDPLDAFGAEDGVDERGQPCGGGEVLGLELLRVREVIAELLDVAGEAVRLAPRMESERSETRGVVHEDVGLVFDLEAIKERALGPAALALRTKRDGFLEAARRDLVLPRVARKKLADRPRQICIEHGDRAEEPHAQRGLLQIAPRDHCGDCTAPLDEHLVHRTERAEHHIEACGFIEHVRPAKVVRGLAERATGEIVCGDPAGHEASATHAEHADVSPPHQLRAERTRLIFIQRRERLREVHGGQAPRKRAAQARHALRFADGSGRSVGHRVGFIVLRTRGDQLVG